MTRRAAPFAAALAAAAAIRLWVAATQTYAVFLDETFQYLEQAHRIVFGYAILPWEYLEGLRSWLLPAALALPMAAAAAVVDSPGFYIPATRAACALLSLTVVWCAWRWGGRAGGPVAGALAAAFSAVWFDTVWFAPAALTETVAAHLALPALCLLDRADRRRLAAAGILLGLAVCLRYQYGPPLAVGAAVALRADWRAWLRLSAWGAATVALGAGALDWATWGAPFHSILAHLRRNAGGGIATAMGVEAATFYWAYAGAVFQPAFLLLPLAVLGAVRAPVPGAVALAVLALHSVVPHKEPRFVYLALAVAPGLIAIGAADLLRRLPRPALGAGAALTAWCALSWLGATGPLAGRWSFHRPTIEAFAAAGRAPGLTGLGVAAPGENGHAAYVHLHRDVPLFFEKPELEIEIDGAPVHLPFEVARQGARAPLGRLSPDGPHSHLIAATAPPGFETVWCYAPARPSAEPPPCLHRRR